MSSPRNDRSFWSITFAVSLALCALNVAMMDAWPPRTHTVAASPPEPLHAPPPQLALPASNVDVEHDLRAFDHGFGPQGVTVGLLRIDAAPTAVRDPAWQPTFHTPSRHWDGPGLVFPAAYRPPYSAL